MVGPLLVITLQQKKGNILVDDLSFITVPANIKKYGGRGMDGNNDGVASPWDLIDAATTAACYLKNHRI
ncbi:hypothetical protein OL548_34745 (plasmid) [Lysinibacillus sp. MHQ-1]|nr:hypothetical protein OL548_34745 [Lysinibacillus sp. MHQ-1]